MSYRTYTTDYAGSALMDVAAAGSGAEVTWESTTESMDRSMLMARDPILFFDEVPLYESELDDNGVSQLRVKVGCLACSSSSKSASLSSGLQSFCQFLPDCRPC